MIALHAFIVLARVSEEGVESGQSLVREEDVELEFVAFSLSSSFVRMLDLI